MPADIFVEHFHCWNESDEVSFEQEPLFVFAYEAKRDELGFVDDIEPGLIKDSLQSAGVVLAALARYLADLFSIKKHISDTFAKIVGYLRVSKQSRPDGTVVVPNTEVPPDILAMRELHINQNRT